MLKAKTLLVSILLAGFAFSPVLASANSWTDRANEGGLSSIGESYGEAGAPQKSIYSIVATIVRIVLSLLGVIFVVLLILAGFKYMTSGGDQDKIKEAVGQIRNAVIGLIIVVTALAITTFVVDKSIPKIMNQ